MTSPQTSWSREFREAEREALVEELRLLRGLTAEQRLADFLALCADGAALEGPPSPLARALDNRRRDAMLERLDRIIHGP